MTQSKTLAIWGAVFCGFGVALGAFGAHALKNKLSPGELQVFETAVRYQVYHGLALLFVSGARGSSRATGSAWILGVILFSGSLILYSVGGPPFAWLPRVTPVGGLLLLGGWATLVVDLARGRVLTPQNLNRKSRDTEK